MDKLQSQEKKMDLEYFSLDNSYGQCHKLVQSESLEKYQNLLKRVNQTHINKELVQKMCEKNNIIYSPLSKFEPFYFEVEKSFAEQYKISVKFGHF